jgi:hypothetical protein
MAHTHTNINIRKKLEKTFEFFLLVLKVLLDFFLWEKQRWKLKHNLSLKLKFTLSKNLSENLMSEFSNELCLELGKHLRKNFMKTYFFQARLGSSSPNFTPADLIRSVNKQIRQSYLRKRLLTTYKALERMSQSGDKFG